MRLAPLSYTLLRVYKDENNVVRFRDNTLVPASCRNKPLPSYSLAYSHRIYFINSRLCLDTNLHGPFLDSAKQNGIISTQHEDLIPLEYENTHELDKALYAPQKEKQLRMWRKHCLMVLYMRLYEKTKDHRKTVADVASRQLGESFEKTENYILKLGLQDKNIYRETKANWKKTPEYKSMQRAASRARMRAKNAAVPIDVTFSLVDLPIKHEGGIQTAYSVPIVCPVLGIKLDTNDSNKPAGAGTPVNQLTVWRKDVRYSLNSRNTCVMSHIASRMIEGKKISQDTITMFFASVPAAKPRWEAWCQRHTVGTVVEEV